MENTSQVYVNLDNVKLSASLAAPGAIIHQGARIINPEVCAIKIVTNNSATEEPYYLHPRQGYKPRP